MIYNTIGFQLKSRLPTRELQIKKNEKLQIVIYNDQKYLQFNLHFSWFMLLCERLAIIITYLKQKKISLALPHEQTLFVNRKSCMEIEQERI